MRNVFMDVIEDKSDCIYIYSVGKFVGCVNLQVCGSRDRVAVTYDARERF